MAVDLNSPSRRFAHWEYNTETKELIHRRSGERLLLGGVLNGNDEVLWCIFHVHDQPWGDAATLDELVEILGTYFGAHGRMIQQRTAEAAVR